ncbi:low molecular weight protein-tyrosine-phosphatase [Humidisolicoccus flavus]|uniref:low molecular weight protein-tyrosine-phosphatase n=1 Tax=Humidisolicoccus flavus TaxID=3111414 RepID=UPI00324BDE15
MSMEPGADQSAVFKICFVCTGNICRSPMAEAVFTKLAKHAGVEHKLLISSAGTSDYHLGEQADHRTVEALNVGGYPASSHRARQFETEWFHRYDLIIACDRSQERTLRSWAPSGDDEAKVRLLMSFDPESGIPDVPDPYYSDQEFFSTVLQQIEIASTQLFRQILPALQTKESK